MSGRAVPATPSTHWLLGGVGDLIRDPLGYVLENRERCGDLFRVQCRFVDLFALTRPEYIDHVLVGNHRNYIKDRPTRSLKLALGEGLVPADGELWRRARRIANPAFRHEPLAGLVDVMVERTEAMLERWETIREPFDVASELSTLTADIVCRTLFGVPMDMASYGASFDVVNAFLTRRFRTPVPLPMWLPTAANRGFRRAVRTIEAMIDRVIRAKRSAATPRHDLLQMLMDARDEETGEAMSDRQLRDQCFTLFGAGHETSANGLVWTLYLLSQHAEQRRQVICEVDKVLGGRRPLFADLGSLGYTLQVLHESMRLYPPAWAIGREAVADDEIDGYRIPRGAQLLISAWAVHRIDDNWENATRFDPARFAPDRAVAPHRSSYLPFGGGPRLCIGRGFALLEMRVILAMILQRFRLDLVPGHPVECEPLISLKPRYGMKMILRRGGDA
jgi:cytochrome P450